jgi:hypothetical protein
MCWLPIRSIAKASNGYSISMGIVRTSMNIVELVDIYGNQLLNFTANQPIVGL